jgi:hypothetical protein
MYQSKEHYLSFDSLRMLTGILSPYRSYNFPKTTAKGAEERGRSAGNARGVGVLPGVRRQNGAGLHSGHDARRDLASKVDEGCSEKKLVGRNQSEVGSMPSGGNTSLPELRIFEVLRKVKRPRKIRHRGASHMQGTSTYPYDIYPR